MDGDLHGFMSFGMRLARPFEISPKRGARTSLYLATSPDVGDQDGHVLGPLQARSYEPPGPQRRGGGQRLWDESERLLASVGFAAP